MSATTATRASAVRMQRRARCGIGGSDVAEKTEKERQLKEGAMRVSCATSTLVTKVARPQLSVTVREVVKGRVNLQVRALTETPCAWDKCIRNGECPDEHEHDPDRPCRSKDTTRTASSRGGTCILQ
jgi:hypothetical protein